MVRIEIEDNKVKTYTHYNYTFIKKARGLQGKWNGAAWEFDIEYIELVKKALYDVYGENGVDDVERLDAIIDLEILEETYNCYSSDEITAFSRTLVKRHSRDSSVKIDPETLILEGLFSGSGGSSKNPRIGNVEGVKLLVKNIPVSMYEKFKDKHNDACSIYENKISKDKISISKENVLELLSYILEEEFTFNSTSKIRTAIKNIVDSSVDGKSYNDIKELLDKK